MDGRPAPLADKLHQARSESRLSTRAVADLLRAKFAISHATVANYEKGRSEPSRNILEALAGIYGVPLSWFDMEGGPVLSGVRYRNLKSKVRVADRAAYEAAAQRWLQAYVRLEERLSRPLLSSVPIPLDPGQTDEVLARELRHRFGIGQNDPVPSVIECLEQMGIRTLELPTEQTIDGFAARLGDYDYAVVLNSNTPNDRCRMDASHEMIHVAIGDCNSDAETKAVEKRAFGIASHFLIPQQELKAAFERKSLVTMVRYKERFGISLAAMVYRAQESELITAREAKWLWMEFSKRGWRKKEPGFVRPDRATRFEDLLDSALNGHGGKLTYQQAESLMGVTESELRQRLTLAMGMRDTATKGGDESPQILQLHRG